MKRRGKKSYLRFVALGGGQEVGASCYFLQINDAYILLDCGKSPNGAYFPDFSTILKPPFLESLNQITQIFISHSHFDHIGAFRYLSSQCRNAGVYATPITKALLFHILWNLNEWQTSPPEDRREEEEIRSEAAIRSIIEIGYCQEIFLPEYTVTFFEAGHIPGAAMVYLQTEDRRILYTGDFSCHAGVLTSSYILPDSIQFDTMIICGLHAKHPHLRRGRNPQSQFAFVKGALERGCSVLLETVQLTKGWEVLHSLNKAMENRRLPRIPVYIDQKLSLLAEEMERMHIPVRRAWNYVGIPPRGEQAALIGRFAPAHFLPVKVDFSLHPTYRELADFIEKYHPKTVVLVHTGSAEPRIEANCLEIELMTRTSWTGHFIYAETGEIYSL
ncbi:MAG: MBL fold metallo-hydrolase [Spirochaetaceae bacterium]|jgi:Cft2 family RNA processing exonuclease|nr:MBL fold metallo-hydrolase [Spirochaetaceae bacterium]